MTFFLVGGFSCAGVAIDKTPSQKLSLSLLCIFFVPVDNF